MCCNKIAEAEAAVSVDEKKWLVMHMHVQLQLDERDVLACDPFVGGKKIPDVLLLMGLEDVIEVLIGQNEDEDEEGEEEEEEDRKAVSRPCGILEMF
jgi:hypothetical protein